MVFIHIQIQIRIIFGAKAGNRQELEIGIHPSPLYYRVMARYGQLFLIRYSNRIAYFF